MILPLIEADGMAVACEPLTRFYLAAITTQADAGSPVTIDALRPPGRHVPLLEQASQILATHLTGLRRMTAPEVNLQPLINTIVAGQELRLQEQANAHLDREHKKNTSVAAWLGGENFARLLKFCGVADEHNLAPLWSPGQRPMLKIVSISSKARWPTNSSPSAPFMSNSRTPSLCSSKLLH
jgi:hypothetical protein